MDRPRSATGTHRIVARKMLALCALAALVTLMGFASPASAKRPTFRFLDAVSGVVRFDPHVYASASRGVSRAGPSAPFAVTNVDTTSQTSPQNETTIDINPLNDKIRVGGINDYRPSGNGDVNCGFTHSSDGGKTWTSGVLTGVTKNNPGAPFNYDAAGDPTVFYGDNGTVYYGCLAFDRSFARSAMLAAKSTDGGATWSTPVAVAQSNSAMLFHDKEMITVDNSPSSPFHGRVYMTWTEFVGPPDSSMSQEVISRSKDGGATWSTPKVVSGAPSNVEGSHAVVAPDGTVYVAWCGGTTICVNGSGPSTIFVAKSTNGGKTWSAPVPAANFQSVTSPLPGNNFRLNSLPTAAVNSVNGDVYVSYAGLGQDTNVYFIRSTDGGTSWSTPLKMKSAAEDQFFQWMRVSPTGTIWICYYDQHWNTGTLLDMSCASSIDGLSFTKGKRFTTLSSNPMSDGFGGAFIGDYTGLALDAAGKPHPLWTDTRTGNADAWTAN